MVKWRCRWKGGDIKVILGPADTTIVWYAGMRSFSGWNRCNRSCMVALDIFGEVSILGRASTSLAALSGGGKTQRDDLLPDHWRGNSFHYPHTR